MRVREEARESKREKDNRETEIEKEKVSTIE